MALIEARNLTLANRLDSVSFTMEPGEMLAVIGPNGAGKSSLLQSLAGLLATEGEILLSGTPLYASRQFPFNSVHRLPSPGASRHPLPQVGEGMFTRHPQDNSPLPLAGEGAGERVSAHKEGYTRPENALKPDDRARKIGFLPQFCESAWALAVEEIVALGRLPWHDRDPEAIRQAMRETGIEGMAQKNINQLSGGEQARVWLARVLAGAPQLILADEPIASLDLYYQAKIMEILRQHTSEGRGVILAIHDLALAARYCDRFCLLKQGRIHAFGSPETVLTEAALSDAFGVPIHVDLAHSPPIILPA